jgi:hypothetical protein
MGCGRLPRLNDTFCNFCTVDLALHLTSRRFASNSGQGSYSDDCQATISQATFAVLMKVPYPRTFGQRRGLFLRRLGRGVVGFDLIRGLIVERLV